MRICGNQAGSIGFNATPTLSYCFSLRTELYGHVLHKMMSNSHLINFLDLRR
jgi:hypothetical protein